MQCNIYEEPEITIKQEEGKIIITTTAENGKSCKLVADYKEWVAFLKDPRNSTSFKLLHNVPLDVAEITDLKKGNHICMSMGKFRSLQPKGSTL